MDAHLQLLKRTAQSEGTAEAWQRYASALERATASAETQDDYSSDKYYLGLNPMQMQTVVDATDMYSRVLVGQLGIIAEAFYFPGPALVAQYGEPNTHEARELLLGGVKQAIYPQMHRNESMGIGGPLTPNRAQRAYDIHQVLRHRLAWNRTREKGEASAMKGVWHYTPRNVSGHPLPPLLSETPCPCQNSDCRHSLKENAT